MLFTQLNLDPKLLQAITACGYDTPTPIQEQAIPPILLGKDVVATAQTGSGKTAAFVLPALNHLALSQRSAAGPQVLILTPTRELASQVTEAVAKYGKFLRLNLASLVGGMSYRQQLKSLERRVDLVVATPGRLLDHLENGNVDLSQVKILVLDEADRMLDMGFIDDVKKITKALAKNRQTLLFSATVDTRLTHLIKQLLHDPVWIDLSQEQIAPTEITQELYIVDDVAHKKNLLKHFLHQESIYKAIIFSATKMQTDRLANDLQHQGYLATALHGDLKQSARNRALDKFRNNKVQFLIATDVAARGINITDITYVINYDLPRSAQEYVHRIGRTGRAGNKGMAISFVLPTEGGKVAHIEGHLKQKLEIKEIVGLEPKKGFVKAAEPRRRQRKKRRNFSGKYQAKKSRA